MANKITETQTLDIGVEFLDTDTGEKRTTSIKLPDYKSSLTEEQIKNAFSNQQVIIYGYDEQDNPQPVTSENIYTASTTNETVEVFDIGWQD